MPVGRGIERSGIDSLYALHRPSKRKKDCMRGESVMAITGHQ
jgi:hypothetical protein